MERDRSNTHSVRSVLEAALWRWCNRFAKRGRNIVISQKA
jgi:hypothetical protein